MSESSPNLALPFILAAQAQKHVTVNEALRILDGLVQLSVIETRADPPASPDPGARYLVAATATAEWAGWEDSVALWDDNAWRRLVPQTGWFLWDAGAATQRRFDGAAWVAVVLVGDFASGEIGALGVATGADATNRLAVASPAVLLTHAGDDHQLKINKASEGDTASVLFQSDWSGRAEMGLAGEDDFSFKVSPDGSEWRESIRIDRTTGRARIAGLRETLSAPRIYHVRTDGDDDNDGLSDSAGGAFLTIGRAIEVAFGSLDLARFDVTISVAPGIYEEWLEVLAPSVGAGIVTIRGSGAEPDDVIIRATSATAPPYAPFGVVRVWNGATLAVDNLQVERVSGPGVALFDVRFGANVTVAPGNVLWFGATNSGGAFRLVGGILNAEQANLKMVGDAPSFILARQGASASIVSASVDLDGRSFSTAAFAVDRCGVIAGHTGATTITGTATGARVQARSNGVIDFGSKALSTLPGDSDGVIDTGGVYLPAP